MTPNRETGILNTIEHTLRNVFEERCNNRIQVQKNKMSMDSGVLKDSENVCCIYLIIEKTYACTQKKEAAERCLNIINPLLLRNFFERFEV